MTYLPPKTDLTPAADPSDVWWRARRALSTDPIASMLTVTVLDGLASVFTQRCWPSLLPNDDPEPVLLAALLPTALSVLSFEARQHLAQIVARAWFPTRYQPTVVTL